MEIDLSFSKAAVVLPKEYSKLRIVLVGAGGTGSFAALAIARLVYELREQGRVVELSIIDPDRVEAGNIPRSNFCAAEIGRFKAQTLAERITSAWGLEVGYACDLFDAEKQLKQTASDYRQLTILVGCVDNHLARRELHRALDEFQGYRASEAPNIWWIDAGNGKFSGQVVLGSTTKRLKVEDHFVGSSICRSLPAPTLIHPELLDDQQAESKRKVETPLSCPERVRLGEQSLNINQRVAVEIAEMLTAFLLTNSLRRFATYFDLESGTSRSVYCTALSIESAPVGSTLPRAKSKRA